MLNGLFSDEAGIPTLACLNSESLFLNTASPCHWNVQSEEGLMHEQEFEPWNYACT